jgi:hypothetical protein
MNNSGWEHINGEKPNFKSCLSMYHEGFPYRSIIHPARLFAEKVDGRESRWNQAASSSSCQHPPTLDLKSMHSPRRRGLL